MVLENSEIGAWALVEGKRRNPEKPGIAGWHWGHAGNGMMGRETFFLLAMDKVI